MIPGMFGGRCSISRLARSKLLDMKTSHTTYCEVYDYLRAVPRYEYNSSSAA
jgi:hypothetical protein